MRAKAEERAIAVAESTTTLERHVAMACFGTGKKNVWTRSVPAGGGAVAFLVRTGRSMVPKTPLWSKKEVERVIVSPVLSARYRGSPMARWLMHVALQG